MKQDHPLAEAFPMLTGRDMADLSRRIGRQGLRNPIVLFEGKVLDGRNRLAACEAASVRPRFTEFKGNEEEAREFVWDQNGERRHLTPAAKVQAHDVLFPPKIGRPEKNTKSGSYSSQSDASRRTGVGTGTVENVRKVRRAVADGEAPRELLDAVVAGDVTPSDAKRILDAPVAVQREATADKVAGRTRTVREAVDARLRPGGDFVDVPEADEDEAPDDLDWELGTLTLQVGVAWAPGQKLADVEKAVVKYVKPLIRDRIPSDGRFGPPDITLDKVPLCSLAEI